MRENISRLVLVFRPHSGTKTSHFLEILYRRLSIRVDGHLLPREVMPLLQPAVYERNRNKKVKQQAPINCRTVLDRAEKSSQSNAAPDSPSRHYRVQTLSAKAHSKPTQASSQNTESRETSLSTIPTRQVQSHSDNNRVCFAVLFFCTVVIGQLWEWSPKNPYSWRDGTILLPSPAPGRGCHCFNPQEGRAQIYCCKTLVTGTTETSTLDIYGCIWCACYCTGGIFARARSKPKPVILSPRWSYLSLRVLE